MRSSQRALVAAASLALVMPTLGGCSKQKLETMVMRQVVQRTERDSLIRSTCDEVIRQTNTARSEPSALFAADGQGGVDSLVPSVASAATSAIERQLTGLTEALVSLGLQSCPPAELISLASGSDGGSCAGALQSTVAGLATVPGQAAAGAQDEARAALRSLLRAQGVDVESLAQGGGDPQVVAQALLRSAVALDFSGPLMTTMIRTLDRLDIWLDDLISSFPLGSGVVGNALRPALDRSVIEVVVYAVERAALQPLARVGAQVSAGQATLPIWFARHACDAWTAGTTESELSQRFVERAILAVSDTLAAEPTPEEVCAEFTWPTSGSCRRNAVRVERRQESLAVEFEGARRCEGPEDTECLREVRQDMPDGFEPAGFADAFDADATPGGANPIAATAEQALAFCGADCTPQDIGLAGGVLLREQRVGTGTAMDPADRAWLESELQRTREELAALGNQVAEARAQWARDAETLRAGQAALESRVDDLGGAINNVRTMVGRMDNTCNQRMGEVADNRQRFAQSLDLRVNAATLALVAQNGGFAAAILENAGLCAACPDATACLCTADQTTVLATVSLATLGELNAPLQLNLPDSIPMGECVFSLNETATARLEPFRSLLYRPLDGGRSVVLTEVRGSADLSGVGRGCVASIRDALAQYPECEATQSPSDAEGQNRQLACLRAANTRAFLMATSGQTVTDVPIVGLVTGDCDGDALCQLAARRVELSIDLTQGDRTLPLTMNWDECMQR